MLQPLALCPPKVPGATRREVVSFWGGGKGLSQTSDGNFWRLSWKNKTNVQINLAGLLFLRLHEDMSLRNLPPLIL